MKKIIWLLTAVIVLHSTISLAEEIKEKTGGKTGASLSRLVERGDTLKISVWKYSDLNSTIVVGANGTIYYPYVGEITVVGKSADDVRDVITRQLDKNYIANPKVDVTIETQLPTIYVVGEVAKPGSYKFEPNLDPLKAVALAGGLTNFASQTAVIIRKNQDGQEIQIKAKLKKLMKANANRDEYQLMPGDIVVVKRSWF